MSEKIGVCVVTPSGSRPYGCTESFTCADCNTVIDEEEVMYINFAEQPNPQWRHTKDCMGNG
jgi:hypothetical protein